jgi:SH3 domain-containing protein
LLHGQRAPWALRGREGGATTVGRRSNRKLGWLVLTVVALLATAAGAATLNNRARLREGPGKDTRVLGWVEEGTTVSIEGNRGGWYAVRAPDGQTGYVWQEHLRFDAGEGAAPTVTPTTGAFTTTFAPVALPAPVPTLPAPPPPPPPDLRPSPVERPDRNVSMELERLRSEIGRLTTAQQELTQRLARGGGEASSSPVAIGSDGSAGAALLFFGGGVVVGWLFGRFGPGRRDRRSRLRL